MGTRVPYDRVLKTKIKLNVIELGMNEELHELEIQNKIKTKTFFSVIISCFEFSHSRSSSSIILEGGPENSKEFLSSLPYHIVP